MPTLFLILNTNSILRHIFTEVTQSLLAFNRGSSRSRHCTLLLVHGALVHHTASLLRAKVAPRIQNVPAKVVLLDVALLLDLLPKHNKGAAAASTKSCHAV